jgi:branched-chain amino acid transport system substrate-binding protein
MEGGKPRRRPVELVVEDDGRSQYRRAGPADRRKYLNDDGIKLLTGIVFSNVAGAVVPEVLDAGAIYISPNAAPSPLRGKSATRTTSWSAGRTTACTKRPGAAAKKLGYTTAVALAPNYQAGKDAIAGFTRLFER